VRWSSIDTRQPSSRRVDTLIVPAEGVRPLGGITVMLSLVAVAASAWIDVVVPARVVMRANGWAALSSSIRIPSPTQSVRMPGGQTVGTQR
jgi:hypothetical protein